jgi:hypothetical protein
MTTDHRSVTDAIAALLVNLPNAPARQLHVAEPVWRFLRDTYVKAMRPETAQAVMGLPIVVDDDLTGGQWQLREDGEVATAGDMAPGPDGMQVSYVPRVGWIAIRADLTEFAPVASWETA